MQSQSKRKEEGFSWQAFYQLIGRGKTPGHVFTNARRGSPDLAANRQVCSPGSLCPPKKRTSVTHRKTFRPGDEGIQILQTSNSIENMLFTEFDAMNTEVPRKNLRIGIGHGYSFAPLGRDENLHFSTGGRTPKSASLHPWLQPAALLGRKRVSKVPPLTAKAYCETRVPMLSRREAAVYGTEERSRENRAPRVALSKIRAATARGSGPGHRAARPTLPHGLGFTRIYPSSGVAHLQAWLGDQSQPRHNTIQPGG